MLNEKGKFSLERACLELSRKFNLTRTEEWNKEKMTEFSIEYQELNAQIQELSPFPDVDSELLKRYIENQTRPGFIEYLCQVPDSKNKTYPITQEESQSPDNMPDNILPFRLKNR